MNTAQSNITKATGPLAKLFSSFLSEALPEIHER